MLHQIPYLPVNNLLLVPCYWSTCLPSAGHLSRTTLPMFNHEIQHVIDVEQSLPLMLFFPAEKRGGIPLYIYACLTFISCLRRLDIEGDFHWCCWSVVVLHAVDVPFSSNASHLFLLSSYVSDILWETSMLPPYLCLCWMERFKHLTTPLFFVGWRVLSITCLKLKTLTQKSKTTPNSGKSVQLLCNRDPVNLNV